MTNSFDSKAFLKNTTNQSGVYRMYNDKGEVIYVGKAKDLKKRLSSYFQKTLTNAKTIALVSNIADIQVTVVHSETDALILENDFIKQYMPKYNVLLRDDKSYPYILITDHRHPRIAYHRGAKKVQGDYFGPYPNGSAVRESLHLMQKLFPIRQCEDSFYRARSRPCLQYQIGRCLGPCVDKVSDSDYQDQVNLAKLFLRGKNQDIIKALVQKMEHAAESMAYEQAANYRDQISALRKVSEQQEVNQASGELDVIGVHYERGMACFHLLFVRSGKILGSRSYFPKVPSNSEVDEVLQSFLLQFYLNQQQRQDLPAEILVTLPFEDEGALQQVLEQRRGAKLAIRHNVRGERAKFMRLASTNAKTAVITRLAHKSTVNQRFNLLEQTLELNHKIQRMECFDISHTQGEATVASCVVFNREGPQTGQYRRFNIKGITPGDDYAAMAQVLKRRLNRVAKEGVMPDVLVIDGGLGQLQAAESIVADLLPQTEQRPLLLGIAKGESRKPGLETIILGESHDRFNLEGDSPALHLLQHIRDESHRFAIGGHRAKRGKARRVSSLEQIEGVGPKRRKALLQFMGGLQQVKSASVAELAKVPGISQEMAKTIHDALRD
ncbi:excinuclease ABC subunit UvrC [Paraferrimonas sedimenticola]|uniref:UvrABC system protein C n=1 Tax=Paraferrimonas sedimenticola TaxID=375674 RepID=A0AA37RV03_9GAMM|nr:excinuclease ABC subunit UvrC [Paraferrimonas sedimenticola]GLP96125.1 UvrABC system protein C [Paraferrimonas sedimenticola]